MSKETSLQEICLRGLSGINHEDLTLLEKKLFLNLQKSGLLTLNEFNEVERTS